MLVYKTMIKTINRDSPWKCSSKSTPGCTGILINLCEAKWTVLTDHFLHFSARSSRLRYLTYTGKNCLRSLHFQWLLFPFYESFCDMFFYPGNVSCFIFVFPFSPAVLRFGSVVAAFAHKMAPFSINPRGGGNWSNFDHQNLHPWDPGGFSF